MLLDGAGVVPLTIVVVDDDELRNEANCFVAEEAVEAKLGVENLNGESEDGGGIAEGVDEGLTGLEKVKGEFEEAPKPLNPPPKLGFDCIDSVSHGQVDWKQKVNTNIWRAGRASHSSR